MSENIVNSFLLYVDTERSKNTNSTGTNVIIPLNESGLQCMDGQYMRLSLVNFSSFRNYPALNQNNNISQMRLTRAVPPAVATVPADVAIARGNYSNMNGVAVNWATNMAAEIFRWLNAAPAVALITQVVPLNAGANLIQPTTAYGSSGSPTGSEGILDVIFECQDAGGVPRPHGCTAFIIQMLVSKGDCWAILGGNRERDPANTTADGMICTVGPAGGLTANQFRVQGRYPMQRYTNDYVYLRTNVQSSNIQTPSFNAGDTDVGPGRVEGSRILARIPSYNEFNYFVTNTQREYFLNLTQRSIPELTLNLTDSAGRELPYNTGAEDLGNMSFSCVIRVEIIENQKVTMMQSAPVKKLVPARLSGNAPLRLPDGGVDSYVTPLIQPDAGQPQIGN